jgi:hypothetical protein
MDDRPLQLHRKIWGKKKQKKNLIGALGKK